MKIGRVVFGLVLSTAFLFNLVLVSSAQPGRVPRLALYTALDNPSLTNIPGALPIITQALATPAAPLSVPPFIATNHAAGTYWTLSSPLPLPGNFFPTLPVYALDATNHIFLIDDRSVDYSALQQQQATLAATQGVAPPGNQLDNATIDTNGLWLSVATNTASDQFNIVIHNTIPSDYYDVLTKVDLLASDWWVEATVQADDIQTPLSIQQYGRTNLFVWARQTVIPIYTQPLSQLVLNGDMVTFEVVAGGSNLSYQWTFNGTNIFGATSSIYTIDSVDPSQAGNYVCIITSPDGTETSRTAILAVYSGWSDPSSMIILGPRQDYVFRTGVTYGISSTVQLTGKTIFDPGTCVKFDETQPFPSLQISGTVICRGTAFNPSVLTCFDDNSYGEAIGSGSPQPNVTGVPYLDLSEADSVSISNIWFRYADEAVSTPAVGRLDVWNGQFFQCNEAIVNEFGGTNSLHNVLIAGCGDVIAGSTNGFSLNAEHLTADVTNLWDAPVYPSGANLTNSIVSGHVGVVNTINSVVNPDPTNFQSAVCGNYYLAAGSPLRGAGTIQVSPGLLNGFANKTTTAPMILPQGFTLNGSVMLSPQVTRYAGGAPDMGYYYDALDYVVSVFTNFGQVTVEPGTVIGFYQNTTNPYYWPAKSVFHPEGIKLREGSSFVAHGMPGKPVVFTDIQWVQEQYETPCIALFVPDFEGTPNDTGPVMDFRFCNFYPAGFWYNVWAGQDIGGYTSASYDSVVNWTMRDCSLHGGIISLCEPDWDGYYYGLPYDLYYGSCSVSWDNNLFDNVATALRPSWDWYDGTINVDFAFEAHNNLFYRNAFWLAPSSVSSGNWQFYDNLFDRPNFYQDTDLPLDYDNNGYWPLPPTGLYPGYASRLQPTTTGDGTTNGLNEVVLDYALPYTNSVFGNYYLSTITPLWQAGSRTAAAAGLTQYTTFNSQAKDASDAPVNIGLHYVVADTNALPLDSDGDGVPDYVEAEYGTDPFNPMTDGVTPDAYNAAYDDVDLDGDGLTGAAERFWGTIPTNSDNPLNLQSPSQQGIISGIVWIPLNINTNVDTNTLFTFQINGLPQSTVVSQTNGNWFAAIDTTKFANGDYFLNLEYDFDDYTPIIGPVKFATIQNAISFPYSNNLPMCGDTLFVQPQTIYTNGTYSIVVYDEQTNLIASIAGPVDQNGYCADPTNGQPGIMVSLLDTNGTHLDSLAYTVIVTASAAATSQNVQPPGANSGTSSSSSSATNQFFYSRSWTTRRWVIASYPAYGNAQYGNQPALDLAEMMEGAANVVHGSVYGTADDAVVNNNNTMAGNPLSLSLNGLNQWNQLRTLLQDIRSRNFFYFGHGASDIIGSRSGNHLSVADLQNLLTNTAAMAPGGWFNSQLHLDWEHPYRFVFLDGCNTANGLLPLAFGIPNCVVSETNWNSRVHSQPRSFLGWSSYTAYSVKNTLPEEHKRFIENFWGDWNGGALLQDALHDATADAESNGQRYTQLDNKITLFGDPDLPFYQ